MVAAREIAVHVDGVPGPLLRAVVGQLDPTLVELGMEGLELLLAEVVLLDELREGGEVEAARFLASGDQRLDRLGRHRLALFP